MRFSSFELKACHYKIDSVRFDLDKGLEKNSFFSHILLQNFHLLTLEELKNFLRVKFEDHIFLS